MAIPGALDSGCKRCIVSLLPSFLILRSACVANPQKLSDPLAPSCPCLPPKSVLSRLLVPRRISLLVTRSLLISTLLLLLLLLLLLRLVRIARIVLGPTVRKSNAYAADTSPGDSAAARLVDSRKIYRSEAFSESLFVKSIGYTGRLTNAGRNCARDARSRYFSLIIGQSLRPLLLFPVLSQNARSRADQRANHSITGCLFVGNPRSGWSVA